MWTSAAHELTVPFVQLGDELQVTTRFWVSGKDRPAWWSSADAAETVRRSFSSRQRHAANVQDWLESTFFAMDALCRYIAGCGGGECVDDFGVRVVVTSLDPGHPAVVGTRLPSGFDRMARTAVTARVDVHRLDAATGEMVDTHMHVDDVFLPGRRATWKIGVLVPGDDGQSCQPEVVGVRTGVGRGGAYEVCMTTERIPVAHPWERVALVLA